MDKLIERITPIFLVLGAAMAFTSLGLVAYSSYLELQNPKPTVCIELHHP